MNFFKDSQTFIDNLQCESQERVHELIKDLELSVTQSELVLRNIGRLCPPCSWPARDAKSHHQQKGRVLERPGPSSQFLYVDCNQGNGTRSESQISVFQLKNVLSVWCSVLPYLWELMDHLGMWRLENACFCFKSATWLSQTSTSKIVSYWHLNILAGTLQRFAVFSPYSQQYLLTWFCPQAKKWSYLLPEFKNLNWKLKWPLSRWHASLFLHLSSSSFLWEPGIISR